VAAPNGRGKALINMLPLEQGERITTIMPLPEDESSWGNFDVMFATTGGNVRRNKLSDFVDVRRSGIIAMKLDDGEAIVDVATATEADDILLTTRDGQCIRFAVPEVRVFQGRTSMGVRGVSLADVDRVIRISQESPAMPVRIDANQAWDLETASTNIEALLAAGVTLEFVEQPLPAWELAGHAELRRRWGVPIVLDESVFTIHDLHRAIAADSGDIVNIKLAKCGGIQAGLAIAREATASGLGLMVGSMMESELGVSAAAALAATISPDAVHDLDAAWWSIDTSDAGSPYRGGRFVLDPSPGSTHAAGRVISGSLSWSSRTHGL